LREVSVTIVVQAVADLRGAEIDRGVPVVAIRTAAGLVQAPVHVQVLVVRHTAAVVVDSIPAEIDFPGVDRSIGVVAIVAQGPPIPIPVRLLGSQLVVAVAVLPVADLLCARMDQGVLVVAVLSTARRIQVTVLVVVTGIVILEEKGVPSDVAVSPEDLEIPVLSPGGVPTVLYNPCMFDVVVSDQDTRMAPLVLAPDVLVHAARIVVEIRVDIECDGQDLLVQCALDRLHVVRYGLPLIDLPDAVRPVRASVGTRVGILAGVGETTFIDGPGDSQEVCCGPHPPAIAAACAARKEVLLGEVERQGRVLRPDRNDRLHGPDRGKGPATTAGPLVFYRGCPVGSLDVPPVDMLREVRCLANGRGAQLRGRHEGHSAPEVSSPLLRGQAAHGGLSGYPTGTAPLNGGLNRHQFPGAGVKGSRQGEQGKDRYQDQPSEEGLRFCSGLLCGHVVPGS